MARQIQRWDQYEDNAEEAFLGGASDVLMYLEQQGTITWEQRRDAYDAMKGPIARPYDDEDAGTTRLFVIGSTATFLVTNSRDDEPDPYVVDHVVAEYGFTMGCDRKHELAGGRLVGVLGPLAREDFATASAPLVALLDRLGAGDWSLLGALSGAIVDDRQDNNIEVSYYLSDAAYEREWASLVRIG